MYLPGWVLVTDICAFAHHGPLALYTNLKSANVQPPKTHTSVMPKTYGFQMFEVISSYRLKTYLINKSPVLDLFQFCQDSNYSWIP